MEFVLDFIHLLASLRRDAAEEDMKSIWKADFTYFPCVENIVRFGEYFSQSKMDIVELEYRPLGGGIP
jgi:hypothetical protein